MFAFEQKDKKIIIWRQMSLTKEQEKNILFTSKIIMRLYIWYWLSFVKRKDSLTSLGLYIYIYIHLLNNLNQMIGKRNVLFF
jgi:hypothetical protein